MVIAYFSFNLVGILKAFHEMPDGVGDRLENSLAATHFKQKLIGYLSERFAGKEGILIADSK